MSDYQPYQLPEVAAAIVTYNHLDAVLKLLASLQKQDIPTFITENNGADNAADVIKTQFPEVSLLASQSNLGGCGGFNCASLAALSSGCKYLLLIDDDAYPEADCIEQLSNFLDNHPDYIFAAPAIYISSAPDTLQEAGGGVDFNRANPIQAWHRFQVKPKLDSIIEIDYASACCLMIRGDALRESGVMDWAYFIFSDDVDLCIRLRQRYQAKGACITTARALHDFPWAKPFAPMRLYFFQRNGLRLICNHRQPGQLKVLLIALMRLHKRLFYSFMIADDEIYHTLRDAFSDAWHDRFGNWKQWVQFAANRQPVDAGFLEQHTVNKILVDINIENFLPDILEKLSLLTPEADIDLLADAHRVEHHQQSGQFKQVFGRQAGWIAPLKPLPGLLKQNYDLVITDANMEPRRATAMAAKKAAIYHNGSLFQASNRPYIACLAHLLSLPIGLLAAFITLNHFRPRFAPGTPPAEAAELLNKIGIDPNIGQPYAPLKRHD